MGGLTADPNTSDLLSHPTMSFPAERKNDVYMSSKISDLKTCCPNEVIRWKPKLYLSLEEIFKQIFN